VGRRSPTIGSKKLRNNQNVDKTAIGMDRALRIGKYLTRRTLGAGSFATVWLAYDEMLDAEVAIKVLADNWARNPDVRRRFIDEAKLMRRIDHDRVVRVHDVDELPDGRPFFVMTWADRGTLADRLPAAGNPPTMSVTDAVSIAVEICECLAVVHDFGAVHRDVKPSNVLFRSVRSHERAAAHRRGNNLGDEQMVLGDFGLAKDLAVASGFTQAAGTPAYMAPEQARSSAIIDHRVDVFGAAAVLYEMLTGRPPLAASTLSGVRRNENGEGIVPVRSLRPDTPPAIAAVVQRALAHESSQRFDSALAFATALEEAMAASAATATADARPLVSGPTLTGAAGRVADLLARARRSGLTGAAALANVEGLLTGPIRVHVLSSVPWASFDAVSTSPAATGATWSNDANLGAAAACDLLVVLDPDLLAPPLPGPLAVLVLGDVPATDGRLRPSAATVVGDDSIGHTHLTAMVANLVERRSLVRTARALAQLAAVADRRDTTLLDAIDALRTELPAVDELQLLRDDTGVGSSLALPLRRDAHRLFFWNAPSARLGVEDTEPGPLRVHAQAALDRWRRLEQDGRIPFAARPMAALVQHSLERLWLELGDP
jgi:tRNA A-37 threonylcarbamoyl transferase component Bud32